MLELNIQLFSGAGDAARDMDNDDSYSDDRVTFSYKGSTYSIPESVYDRIGKGIGTRAQKKESAIAVTKFIIANGTAPKNFAEFQKWAEAENMSIDSNILGGKWDFNEYDELYSKFSQTLAAGNIQVNGQYTTNLADPSVGMGVKIDNAKEDALNLYYKDLYNTEGNTSGQKILSKYNDIYREQAQTGIGLADAGLQASVMQQAAVVKNITDQIRNERMQRLRAGMSESQIANQDMQMLMANVNALNQNQQMTNQARLEAEANARNAQGMAYESYLKAADGRAAGAAAMYASDVGNPTYVAMQNLNKKFPNGWTSAQYDAEYKAVTNNNSK